MNRRALLASLAYALALPHAFATRPEKVYRLGVLWEGTCPPADFLKQWFVLKRLSERGYVEGRNFVVESRCTGADSSQAPQMASELVRLRPDVLFTMGVTATRALHDATKTIPIVTNVHDPVGNGFARTLSKPGGNVTGRALSHPDTPTMQVELIRRAIPALRRLTLIGDVDYPQTREVFRAYDAAASVTGLGTEVKLIRASGFERAFREMRSAEKRAAFIYFTLIEDAELARAAQLAIRLGVPTMYHGREYVEQGGLMSFSNYHSSPQRIIQVIDNAFKGANPADTPWELPDRVHFAINLRTAKLLGLTISPALVARADQVVG